MTKFKTLILTNRAFNRCSHHRLLKVRQFSPLQAWTISFLEVTTCRWLPSHNSMETSSIAWVKKLFQYIAVFTESNLNSSAMMIIRGFAWIAFQQLTKIDDLITYLPSWTEILRVSNTLSQERSSYIFRDRKSTINPTVVLRRKLDRRFCASKSRVCRPSKTQVQESCSL